MNKNNLIVKKCLAGIAFKYLDGIRNFDIGEKRLANVGDLEDYFDVDNRDFIDSQYNI